MIEGFNGMELLPFTGLEHDYSHWFNNEKNCMFNNHYRYPMYIEDKPKPDLLLKICFDKGWIGNIALNNIDHINSQAELSLIIDSQFFGKGYGFKACYLLCTHAFLHLNLNRLYLGTHNDNEGMKRIAVKLGFLQEGLRRNAIYKYGQYHDIIEYGILKYEFLDKSK